MPFHTHIQGLSARSIKNVLSVVGKGCAHSLFPRKTILLMFYHIISNQIILHYSHTDQEKSLNLLVFLFNVFALPYILF